jgi:ACS family hexuronate transporter-like MFS transporter
MATGIFNLGAGTGAVLAPPLVGYLVLSFGWQAAFMVTGLLGFLWAAIWLVLYRSPEQHPLLSPEELTHIRDGEDDQNPSPAAVQAAGDRNPGRSDDRLDAGPTPSRGVWKEALARPEIWPIIAARILSDPVWLFYLMWLPDYLNRVRGFNLKAIALFGWIPFLSADLGSLVGGGISSWFVKRGLPTLKARKVAMCLCASLMPAAIPAVLVRSPITAIVFISIATFGHQSWSASFITLPADLFPKRIVASVFGLTAMCGFLAGAGFTEYVGRVVDTIGYVPVFTIVGFMHLIATAILALSIKSRRPATVTV